MIAHVAGMPVEEILPALATSSGAALLLARAWVAPRVRRRRRSGGMG